MKRDRIMSKLIPQFGDMHLVGRGDPFTTLARSIVGQQISVKAAEDRLGSGCWSCARSCTPRRSSRPAPKSLPAADCRSARAEYILDLAEHFKAKRVHVDQWVEMEDEDVIAELMQIRGIGRWTAEMFLIFNLLRPECPAAGRPRPDPRHQRQLFFRRAGLAQRCARSRRQLGALAHGRNVVSLAQSRSGCR